MKTVTEAVDGAVFAASLSASLPGAAGARDEPVSPKLPTDQVVNNDGSVVITPPIDPGLVTVRPEWGLLANPEFDAQAMKTVFFFAGDWRGAQSAIERYTVYPADARHLGWSGNANKGNRDFVVNEMIRGGTNVITMSYWGEPWTDRWALFAPQWTDTQSHTELFSAAVGKNILIMPTIESAGSSKGLLWADQHGNVWAAISGAYIFRDDFPGTAEKPAPMLVDQIVDLVTRYVTNPGNPAWRSKWAQMYNRTREPQYAIHIMHVASYQPQMDTALGDMPTKDALFAEGFDRVAAEVERRTGGVRVGFVLDVLPFNDGRYYANSATAGWWLGQSHSIIGVQCFIPEVYMQPTDDMTRVGFKRSFLQGWIDQGIPVFLDVAPGYDARHVFKGSPRWGHTDQWRNALSQLRSLRIKGIAFNSWNGYTEGMVAVKQFQAGAPIASATDTNYRWLQSLFTGDPREPFYTHFISGQPVHVVYGAICAKWFALEGNQGPLGTPTSSERNAEVAGARCTDFQGGRIYWTPQHGAFEVHGAIFELYQGTGGAAGPLGLPVSDEEPDANGGRKSGFARGTVHWHPSGEIWVTP